MAEYLIQSDTLDDIADAINAKTGGSSAMTPAEMVTAIESISGGTSPVEFTLSNAYTSAGSLRRAIQSATGLTNFFVRTADTAPSSGYFLYGGIYISQLSGGGEFSATLRRNASGTIAGSNWKDSTGADVPAGSNWIAWGVADYA